MRATVPTNLMPQHAFQPVLSGCGDVDGQCGPAVHHCHGSSGQEVISHLDYNLSTQIQISVTYQQKQCKISTVIAWLLY